MEMIDHQMELLENNMKHLRKMRDEFKKTEQGSIERLYCFLEYIDNIGVGCFSCEAYDTGCSLGFNMSQEMFDEDCVNELFKEYTGCTVTSTVDPRYGKGFMTAEVTFVPEGNDKKRKGSPVTPLTSSAKK